LSPEKQLDEAATKWLADLVKLKGQEWLPKKGRHESKQTRKIGNAVRPQLPPYIKLQTWLNEVIRDVYRRAVNGSFSLPGRSKCSRV
jgi:hypothetical protein